MRLRVSTESDGAGSFQIEAVQDADTGKVLPGVDLGGHFSTVEELKHYLRSVFGAKAVIFMEGDDE